MRKRNIKIVAHWVIMCFVLLFPIVMVGISGFSSGSVSTENVYLSNEVNTLADIKTNHIYHFENTLAVSNPNRNQLDFLEVYNVNVVSGSMYNRTPNISYSTFGLSSYYSTGSNYDLIYQAVVRENGSTWSYEVRNFVGSFDFVVADSNQDYSDLLPYISMSDYYVISNYSDTTLKSEINSWSNEFVNLDVNNWYKTLLNVIGIGFTNNSVMNVMYIYPLYVIWVYVLDVLVDIFLVIVKIGHNALERLGADND